MPLSKLAKRLFSSTKKTLKKGQNSVVINYIYVIIFPSHFFTSMGIYYQLLNLILCHIYKGLFAIFNFVSWNIHMELSAKQILEPSFSIDTHPCLQNIMILCMFYVDIKDSWAVWIHEKVPKFSTNLFHNCPRVLWKNNRKFYEYFIMQFLWCCF